MSPVDLSQWEAVLLDLDGTVYHEDQPLPGAIELIRALQASGRTYACLSNSVSSPDRIATRLAAMGVEVPPRLIHTSAAAASHYVLHRYPGGRVFNLASPSFASLVGDGVIWVEHASEPCDAVAVAGPSSGLATEERQRVALQHLRRGADLIGLCADRVFPSPRGIEFGAGAMTAMLAYAADVTPTYCGKPEPIFFLDLCGRLGVAPGQCVLIGDNLESDVQGARGVGMASVLVLSGVARPADLIGHRAQPDFVVESLVASLTGV